MLSMVARTGRMRKFHPMPETPLALLPRAAAQPATCVPCPCESVTSPPSTSAVSVKAL